MATDPGSFNIDSINDYLKASKTALDLIKGAIGFLPKGEDQQKAQEQVREAESALQLSQASAAKTLGYRLCKCTFPPQIMLWNEKEQAHVCPNPECGKREGRPKVVTTKPRGGGGRNSWMA